ncbi:hypothetical protein [Undibacterium sp. TJN19]
MAATPCLVAGGSITLKADVAETLKILESETGRSAGEIEKILMFKGR